MLYCRWSCKKKVRKLILKIDSSFQRFSSVKSILNWLKNQRLKRYPVTLDILQYTYTLTFDTRLQISRRVLNGSIRDLISSFFFVLMNPLIHHNSFLLRITNCFFLWPTIFAYFSFFCDIAYERCFRITLSMH